MAEDTFADRVMRAVKTADCLLEISPVASKEYRWFGECRRTGPGYHEDEAHCFTFSPARDADTLLRSWVEHVERDNTR